MSGGWRRNLVALAALVVLVPATVGIVLQQERTETANAFGEFPVTGAPGEALTVDGVVLGPAEGTLRGPGTVPSDVPADTRVLVVTLPVDVGAGEGAGGSTGAEGAGLGCLSPILREAGGLGRDWTESSFELGYGFFGDDERLTSCPYDDVRRFELTLSYLIPEDATGPFVVDLVWADLLPRLARIPVVG